MEPNSFRRNMGAPRGSPMITLPKIVLALLVCLGKFISRFYYKIKGGTIWLKPIFHTDSTPPCQNTKTIYQLCPLWFLVGPSEGEHCKLVAVGSLTWVQLTLPKSNLLVVSTGASPEIKTVCINSATAANGHTFEKHLSLRPSAYWDLRVREERREGDWGFCISGLGFQIFLLLISLLKETERERDGKKKVFWA